MKDLEEEKKMRELWSIFIISSIWTTPLNSLGKNLENSLEEWERNDGGMRKKMSFWEKKKRKKKNNFILNQSFFLENKGERSFFWFEKHLKFFSQKSLKKNISKVVCVCFFFNFFSFFLFVFIFIFLTCYWK